jgi:hypothetical protein
LSKIKGANDKFVSLQAEKVGIRSALPSELKEEIREFDFKAIFRSPAYAKQASLLSLANPYEEVDRDKLTEPWPVSDNGPYPNMADPMPAPPMPNTPSFATSPNLVGESPFTNQAGPGETPLGLFNVQPPKK